MSRTEGLVAGAALLVVTLSLSTLALRVNHEGRSYNTSVVEQSLEFAADGATDPLIVIAELQPAGTGRLYWQAWGEGEQVLQNPSFAYLYQVLFAAERSGRDEVVVVSDLDRDTFADALADPLEEIDWQVLGGEQLGDTALTAIRVGRSSG